METKTILVADDDPAVIELLNNMLRPSYKVKAATRGREALDVLCQTPHPDLVLLDVLMPGLDGYEVCRQIKQTPMTRAIPVIFVTGNASPEEIQHGHSLGGADYLTKPLDPDIVLSKVKALIG